MKRKKSVIYRIAFYSRKMNEYSAARFDFIRGHTVIAAPSNRYARLLAYRAAMYRLIDADDADE